MSRAILFAYVAIGGAVGSGARYALTLFVQSRSDSTFPIATLLINISGSVLLGFLMRIALGTNAISPETRVLLTTGFCGGYTTFSTFTYETMTLIEDGESTRAGLYIVLSVVLSLAGAWLGTAAARGLIAIRAQS